MGKSSFLVQFFSVYYCVSNNMGLVVVVFSDVLWFEFVSFDSVSFNTVIGKSGVRDCACSGGEMDKPIKPKTVKIIMISIGLNICITLIIGLSKYKTNNKIDGINLK